MNEGRNPAIVTAVSSPSDAGQVADVAGRSADGPAGRGIGLAEKRSQPFKSTTVCVAGRLSHADDDHPRRRMLGHDQGSQRPLRGQPVTRRSAGRGGKA